MLHRLETISQDIRYGLRTLARYPIFTAVAIFTLALGIGANSAIFSAVNAVLLRALPFEEPDRLVRLYMISRSGNPEPASWDDIADWREQNQSFTQVAAFESGTETLSNGEDAEDVSSGYAGTNFFQLFRVNPIQGRIFSPDEHVPNGPQVVAIGERFWKDRFGSDPGIIGQTLVINGASNTIVGIMPDRFDTLMGRRIDLWFPAKPSRDRGIHHLPAIARLKPGVTIPEARAEMSGIATRLGQAYPATNEGWGATLVPLQDSIVGNVRLMLLVLLGAVGLILLIACANVANLLLARAAARSGEVAIRSALGATRGRLMRQFLTEALILSLGGGILGLLLAYLATKLITQVNPGDIPRLDQVNLDGNVIWFTILVTLGTTFIFGVVPALRLSEVNFIEAIKGVGRGNKGSRTQKRVRQLLVVTELAISLVVLIGCGLLMRSFYRLQSVNPGFSPQNLVTAQIPLRDGRYKSPEARNQFYLQLLEQIHSLPGVQSVALTSTLPMGGGGPDSSWDVSPEGLPETEDGLPSRYRRVSPGYFQTMQIPLIAGRDFEMLDGDKDHPVIIISQSVARTLWPDESAIGKRVIIGEIKHEVIGVVGDVKTWGLDSSDITAAYAPLPQDPSRFLAIAARTTSENVDLSGPIKGMIRSLDKKLPVEKVRSMNAIVDYSLAGRRFNLYLSTIFAGLALLLAAIGTYSVISYSVAERTQEIGIRMALGASAKNITFLVVGQATQLAIVGVVLGVAGAYALTQIMESLLYGVTSKDPVVFILAPVFLLVIALAASYRPVRRAMKVDPMLALRTE